MKTYLRAMAMCFSMFCAIPSPFKVWDEDARPKMPLFLPAVGLLLGLLWALLAHLARLLALPGPLAAALVCAFPYVATGFLHMDGFMDVTDAVKSWRDLPERRRILKDSHTGAFAVVACALALLFGFAFFASAADAPPAALIFIPVVTRACAGLAVTLLPPMETSQYAGRSRPKGRGLVLGVTLAAALALGFLFCGAYGFAGAAAALGYALGLWRAYRSLGGMSGDISGYALTIGELCGAAAFALL